jgi:hypothetical protein
MALVTGLSSVISGMQVGYEHYRGSYSRRVMYTPPISSLLLAGAGVAGFRSPRIARTALPAVSVVTLVNCVAGFYFHMRGFTSSASNCFGPSCRTPTRHRSRLPRHR